MLENNEQSVAGQVSSAIYGVLAGANMIAAAAFKQMYFEPQLSTLEGQIQHANRFWRDQLSSFDTPEARNAKLYLQDGIDLDLWIRNFCMGVLPTILNHELPNNFVGPSLADKYDVEKICAALSGCTLISQGDKNG